MALRGNIDIVTDFDKLGEQLDTINKEAQRVFEFYQPTPQWLQECSLEPIPPIDMKAVYAGEGLKVIPLPELDVFKDAKFGEYVSVYAEVDKYSENEYH